MSHRITLMRNPLSHPGDFVKIAPAEAEGGDIYQGTRNPNKWYQNTACHGEGGVDSWRTYWRPRPGANIGLQLVTRGRMSRVSERPVSGSSGSSSRVPVDRPSRDLEEAEDLPSSEGIEILETEQHGNGFASVLYRLVVQDRELKDVQDQQLKELLNEKISQYLD